MYPKKRLDFGAHRGSPFFIWGISTILLKVARKYAPDFEEGKSVFCDTEGSSSLKCAAGGIVCNLTDIVNTIFLRAESRKMLKFIDETCRI